ncbi:hypothetical protein AA0Y32_00410 [Georgenia phoenicis]|uniref:hypothetical protein n=1 Tax=unclassified Georgenia TaxID=2626815 RepID=UPI0039AF08D6
MNGLAAVVSLAMVAGGVSAAPGEPEGRTSDVVHEAMAVVGQQTAKENIEVVGQAGSTVRAETEDGTFAVTAEPGVDAAVVQHEDGLQVMAVLEDGATQTTYDLTVPEGVELVPSGDAFEFVVEEGGSRLSLGEIEAPWAVDAEGRLVETSYELDGQRLVQHIEGDVTYPVVADPRLTFGVGVYLNMWGWEMNAVSTAIVAAGGAAAVATCALNKVPAGLASLTKLLCTAVGAPTLAAIYREILKVWRDGSDVQACYQARIVGPRTAFTKVGAQNCG